jgi:prepilin-type N-terminal cleavage/methylation domain-containing protein
VSRTRRGYTLAEALTVVAILGTLAVIAIPSFFNMRRRSAVRAAATELRTLFHLTRSRAIARNANSAVKFAVVGDEWTYSIYDDGDDDGVRNDDIRRGVDARVTPARPVLAEAKFAQIGLPPSRIVDPDGDPLLPSASPVQFNRSTLASFSPLGEATPGTVYVTEKGGNVFAIRVFGATAKMRVLRYDAKTRKWKE